MVDEDVHETHTDNEKVEEVSGNDAYGVLDCGSGLECPINGEKVVDNEREYIACDESYLIGN